jgi:mono/diheme cytochrome c family protein
MVMMYGRTLFVILAAAYVGGLALAHAQATTRASDPLNGKRIYMAVGCYLCHGTAGQGGRPSGPHIAPNPLPFAAFAQHVRHPSNTMPPYTAAVLSDQDLGDIYSYLVTIPPLPDPAAAGILNNE